MLVTFEHRPFFILLHPDAWFGPLSFIPNMILKFGLHSGENLYTWLGQIIEAKMDDPNITFQQVSTQIIHFLIFIRKETSPNLNRNGDGGGA